MKQILKTISKYKLSSSLTIFSLVVAFLGVIILTLYVSFEYSFDKFHKNRKDIYRLSFNYDFGHALPRPLMDLVQSKTPEVEQAVVVSDWWHNNLYKPEQNRSDAIIANLFSVNESFFTVFDFPLVYGNTADALKEPYTIVLTESMAKKIFGETNVVGRGLMVRGDKPYTVTGIIKDMPQNTIFKSDGFVSFASCMQPGDDWRGAQSWGEWSFNLFFQLKKGTNIDEVCQKISVADTIIAGMEKYISEAYTPEAAKIKMDPVSSIHFMSEGYLFPTVNKKVLNVLSLLIVILVIMGIVNFVNFTTSQAPLRAKALSIQQILGSRKLNSRLYIIGEAVVLSLISLGIALLVYHFSFKFIESFYHINGLGIDQRGIFYVIFILFAILFGLLAGFYPSVYITSSPVSQAVKGKMFFSSKGKHFRTVLITAQFVFSIALIASAITIEKQLKFWNNFDIGINKENVLYMHINSNIEGSNKSFADELLKNPEITDYCFTQFLPGQVGMGWGREIDGKNIQIKAWPIDDRFLDFFDIKIKDGRKFIQGESDINKFILNERAIQRFGWEKPLEKKFPGFNFEGEIVGISKNFNFSSLKEEIEPMLFWRTETRKNTMMIRARTNNYTQLKKYILQTAQKIDPNYRSEAKFLDEALENQYSKETNMARFIETIAMWTILLAITGLLGLIIFISRDRIKEIGVRKVNGATISEIMNLLNKKVLIWIGIAFVIATPIAYYAMNKWLQGFAYKTTLNWWIFVLAGIIALAIALLTVSWQSWHAASRNPVEALRHE